MSNGTICVPIHELSIGAEYKPAACHARWLIFDFGFEKTFWDFQKIFGFEKTFWDFEKIFGFEKLFGILKRFWDLKNFSGFWKKIFRFEKLFRI